MAGLFDDLIEEEKREQRENPTDEDIKRNFLNDEDFGRKIIFFFPSYLASILPKESLNKKYVDLSPILSAFQNKFLYLQRTEGWSEEMMKTVIWNICLENEPNPYKLSTFLKYEDKYYAGLLRDYRETDDGRPMD